THLPAVPAVSHAESGQAFGGDGVVRGGEAPKLLVRTRAVVVEDVAPGVRPGGGHRRSLQVHRPVPQVVGSPVSCCSRATRRTFAVPVRGTCSQVSTTGCRIGGSPRLARSQAPSRNVPSA